MFGRGRSIAPRCPGSVKEAYVPFPEKVQPGVPRSGAPSSQMSQNPGNFQEDEYEHLMGKRDCQVPSLVPPAAVMGTALVGGGGVLLRSLLNTKSPRAGEQSPAMGLGVAAGGPKPTGLCWDQLGAGNWGKHRGAALLLGVHMPVNGIPEPYPRDFLAPLYVRALD